MVTQLLNTVASSSELDLLTGTSLPSYIAFTFFVGTMAMMAASVFFFFEMRNVAERWRTSMLVSGLITFIAAVHYYYMRGFFMEHQASPTFFRVLFDHQKGRCQARIVVEVDFRFCSDVGNWLLRRSSMA
ncbi:MAG: hypothetical protein RL712_1402 [Bacteroidota bacterium]